MRIVVIGATGHIGSYLVPRLLAGEHEVVAVSRGVREPYRDAPEWERVERVALDRQSEEARGAFGRTIAELKPDVVVDLICFHRESAEQLTEALRGRVGHLLHCGTLWVHGPSEVVPTEETAPRRPFGAYGRWFGREAEVEFLPWAEWRETVSAEDARLAEDHLAHSPCASIAKARGLLGYQPCYSSLQAVRESLSGLIRRGQITGPALDPAG